MFDVELFRHHNSDAVEDFVDTCKNWQQTISASGKPIPLSPFPYSTQLFPLTALSLSSRCSVAIGNNLLPHTYNGLISITNVKNRDNFVIFEWNAVIGSPYIVVGRIKELKTRQHLSQLYTASNDLDVAITSCVYVKK